MKHGFSLVELSIVLVILGLLTGGILTGQSLIRAAELRAVTTEFTQYQTAVQTFRDKYFALPGDMRNATDFWGAADGDDGVGPDCRAIVSSGVTTCNGSGDGRITDDASFAHEMFRAWHHLANADLVSGSFSGTREPAALAWLTLIGYNIPASKQGLAGWGFCHPTARQYNTGDALRLIHSAEGNSSGECSMRRSAGLTPEEAWNIDTKLDDGRPGQGSVLGLGGYLSAAFLNCVTGGDSAPDPTVDYDLTETGGNCLLQFLL